MTCSICFSGVIFLIFSILICYIYEEFISDHIKKAKIYEGIFLICSLVITLTTFICSFKYKNFTHMFADMKYDNIIYLEYKANEGPNRPIEADKVIFQSSEHGTITTIMAWNNNTSIKTKYDNLIKGKK